MKNILIIVLDSYRADYYWREGKEMSPELKELEKDFAAFRNAYTTASWSLPSHTSLLTGFYPSEHKKQLGLDGSDLKIRLKTLTDVAKDKGYITAGFSSNPWVGKLCNFNKGFDLFVEYDFEISQGKETSPFPLLSKFSKLNRLLSKVAVRDIFDVMKRPMVSRKMTDGLIEFMEEAKGKNFFAFINFMDPHTPYNPPKKLLKKFDLENKTMGQRKFNKEFRRWYSGERKIDSELKYNMDVYYKASLANASEQVGRIISALKEQGKYDDTAIVILSDHGKNLGDYNRQESKLQYIMDINTNILLLTKIPGLIAGERKEAVSLIDIFYSLKEDVLNDKLSMEVNLDRPTLRERLDKDNKIITEIVVPFTGKKPKNLDNIISVSTEKFKYVLSEKEGEFLFDKQGEINNPEKMKELKDYYENWKKDLVNLETETSKDKIDKNVKKRLEALGYLK